MMNQEIFDLQKSQNIPFCTTLEVEMNRLGEQNFKFPNDTDLAKRFIIGIFITFPDSNSTAISRSGRELLAVELMNNAYLTLTSNSKDFLKKAPLRMFDVTGKPLLYVPIYAEGLTLRDSEISLSQKLENKPNGDAPDYVVETTFIYL